MSQQTMVRWDPERGWVARRGPGQPEVPVPVAGNDDDPTVVKQAAEAQLGVAFHHWSQTAQPDGRIAYIGVEAGGLRAGSFDKLSDWGLLLGGVGGVFGIGAAVAIDMDATSRLYLLGGGAAGILWAGYGFSRIRHRFGAKRGSASDSTPPPAPPAPPPAPPV